MRSQITLWQDELLWILNLYEIQTIRMRGDSTEPTVTRLQGFTHPFDRALSGPNSHQHTGEITHHVVQEGIGPHIQDDHPPVLDNLQMMHRLDRRFGLAFECTERGEVMGADQHLCSFTHALNIERSVVPGDLFGHMRGPNLIVINHITVTPRACLEAGMKMR